MGLHMETLTFFCISWNTCFKLYWEKLTTNVPWKEQHPFHYSLGQILLFDAISFSHNIYDFLGLISGFGNTYPNIDLKVEYFHACCLLRLENGKQNWGPNQFKRSPMAFFSPLQNCVVGSLALRLLC